MRGPCSGFDFLDQGYEVLRQIGTGQFGRALMVRQIKDNELRTAKIVDLSPLDESDAYLAAQETNLLRRVQDNPHIVSLCDHFIYQNIYLVIVMEYCQGGDMARCIRSMRWAGVRFQEAEVVVMLRQLLLGLECIHDRSILHRDLKPSNILLTADGQLKIADFGVSRQLDFTVANARTSIGTPQYMPPEMMMRKPYMFFSDMWSLGCVLYEMLTCRPAFDDAAPVQLAFRVCFTPPDAMEGTWSPQLRDIVHRLLSKEPEQRPKPSQLLAEPYLNGVTHPAASAMPYQPPVGRLSMVYETVDEDLDEEENLPPVSEDSSASIPELCAPAPTPKEMTFFSPPTRTPSSRPLVVGELMEFTPTIMSSATSVSSCFKDETIEDDLSYCELILHRINLGLKRHQLPGAAAMLQAAGKWMNLQAMVENLTRAMCGGQEVGLVMRGNFHQSILLEIIRANLRPLWESAWSPTSNTEVDGALAESVTPEWLEAMSAEFNLGLSTAECELLLKTTRTALKRQRVALRDFLPCMSPVGMLTYAFHHVVKGETSETPQNHVSVRNAQTEVEQATSQFARACLDSQTCQPLPAFQNPLPLATFAEMVPEQVIRFALKTVAGAIDVRATAELIAQPPDGSPQQTSTSSIPDSGASSQAEPHQMLHSFYEKGLNLHHAQSDVVFSSSRPSQRASDEESSMLNGRRSSAFSRRMNGSADNSPLSMSRLTTSPADLIMERRLPLTRAVTTQTFHRRSRRRRRRSDSSVESPRLPRASLNSHAPLQRLRQMVRRMSSGEVRALPTYQGEDGVGLVMVFPDGSWMSNRRPSFEHGHPPADEDLLRAMLHSLKAHEKTTERIIRELQSLRPVQMQLQFAKSVGHEWLHMVRQIMHKTLEDQQHRLMQAEYALYPSDGPSWREQAVQSIRDLSKALVQALRNVKGRLKALTLMLSPSVCSPCDLVGDVGFECVKRFDRATLRVLDVLASMKPGVDAARFIDDAEARIRRRTYICAYPKSYLWTDAAPSTAGSVDRRTYDRWPNTQVLQQRRTRFLIRHSGSAEVATSSSSECGGDRRLTRAASMRYQRKRHF